MRNESRKLPLREAYAFGIASGLETEIEQIRSMPIMWPPDTLQYETSLRCAHIIVLFEKHGIFEEFKTKHWPNGNTEDGERLRRHYLSIKQRYEEASAVGENRSGTTGQAATLKELFDDDWASEVVAALGEPSTWEPWVQEWMKNLSHALMRVKAADRAERNSREFQRMLWEANGVAAPGQGNISVKAALDDADFREWLSERSFEPLPEGSRQRIAFLTSLHDDLTSRLQAFVPERTPYLKIFRVMAALYPECMTTIADRGKILTLAKRFDVPRSQGPVGCHVLLRERLDPPADAGPAEPLTLAARMVAPWLLYQKYCEPTQEKRTEEPTVRPGDKVRLRPLPAIQRLRGLGYLPDDFAGILAVLGFVGEGVRRDELIEFLRTVRVVLERA